MQYSIDDIEVYSSDLLLVGRGSRVCKPRCIVLGDSRESERAGALIVSWAGGTVVVFLINHPHLSAPSIMANLSSVDDGTYDY
eukprot:3756179-Pyramimonas_sp.AAC.1